MAQEGEQNIPEMKYELVGEEEESKNWKGMALSFLVIVAIISMVIIAIVINKPVDDPTNKKPLTLSDLIQNYEPKNFDGQWISTSEFAYQTEDKNIKLFNCNKLNSTKILANNKIIPMVGENFKFVIQNDPSIIMLAFDHKNVHRHSFNARYKLYNIETNTLIDVIPPETYQSTPLQNALLAPNGNKVAFVSANNIFLMADVKNGNKEAIQLTTDGLVEKVFNGIADWLYEEEIFSATNAMYWSPNSQFLAYIRFNDSLISPYFIPYYDKSPYSFTNILYPVVGSKNPIVSVFVYDTTNKNTVEVTVPESVSKNFGDYYIWNVKFLSDSEIIVVYVDRQQKSSITVINDVSSGAVNMQKEYPAKPSSTWITPKGLAISNSYDFYFQIWSIENYDNILAFDRKNGAVKLITTHKFDVTSISNVNDKLGEIFYIATNGDPKQRHLYRKSFIKNSPAECLTCKDAKNLPDNYTEPTKHMREFNASEKCLYHDASFSSDGGYYALECLGDRLPITYIRSSVDNKLNFTYEDNAHLREIVDTKLLPRKAYLTVDLGDDEKADAEIYYPIDFKPLSQIYPVLIHTYGSPTSQLVDYRFNIRKFEAYMSINFNVIVAFMDGRGTGANGEKFTKSVYQQLGNLELDDVGSLGAAMQTEKYTDDSRFAIWGWSYGGYLSGLALLNETTPFQCGISGAPVTDWTLYDSAYTERFMGLYPENSNNYQKSSLLELAKRNSQFYAKRNMLLIHGTGDDNVHFENSALLAMQLRQTNLDLDFEVYPNDRHTPSTETQRVLFKKMTLFLLNCYNIDYREHYGLLDLEHLKVVEEPPPE